MKPVFRPLVITGVYLVVVAVFSIVLGFVYAGDLPLVLPPDLFVTKVLMGQHYIMDLFASALLTGLLTGFSYMFSAEKYSAARAGNRQQLNNFGVVLVYSIACASLAFCSLEVGQLAFLRGIDSKNIKYQNYHRYMTLAEDYLAAGNVAYAQVFLDHARDLYPESPDLEDVARRVERVRAEAASHGALYPAAGDNLDERFPDVRRRDALDYLEAAALAFDNGQYIDAHYYASLAQACSNPGEANYVAAKTMAADAWNMLPSAESVNRDSEEGIFFSDKLRGYAALTRGDVIEAYYAFSRLMEEYPDDPEVKQYYAVSKEQLESRHFYFDETDNLRTFELNRGVRFTLPESDGTVTEYYISGITVVEDASQMIQYFRNLSVVKHLKDGRVDSVLMVPYAKMTAQPVPYGKKTRNEPFVQLVCVDRNDSHNALWPSYSYSARDEEVPSVIHLPISYADFNLIRNAAGGPASMNLFQLYQFSQIADKYGYSKELYFASFMHRVMYPFIMLVLMVLIGVVGFQYRVRRGGVFKFKWIVVFPFFTILLHAIVRCILFLMDAFHLAGIAVLGRGILPVSLILHAALLCLVSFMFVFRHAE